MKKRPKALSVFVLAMMNVAIVLSLRGLPLMAEEGTALIFFLLFSLITFLIPTALVSAELATGWPEEGGVFRWVSEAFGPRWGLTAIWLQWMQNIFWYPTALAFAAGALAYFFGSPELANNPLYNAAVILGIYWGSTLVNLRGIKASGILSSYGVILGTVFPGILIIVLGLFWFFSGQPQQIEWTAKSFFPHFSSFSNLSLLAGIILLFAGMEVNAVHAKEVQNPKRSYPIAIFISVIIIFLTFFLGSLSVAIVIPQQEISLTAGIMQAFQSMLTRFHLEWLTPLIGLFITFGVLGGVAAWIIGPTRGIYATAKKGLIPSFFAHTNAKGAASSLLFFQGIIVSVVSLVYFFAPTINSAFFLLTDLTVILYLLMYLLLFAAGITLRYKQPHVERTYRIPGGNWGMWLVAGVGILASLFAIFVGFFPPEQIQFGSLKFYIGFLVVGTVVSVLLPQIIYKKNTT
jgi:glutamate:GABA antiporter